MMIYNDESDTDTVVLPYKGKMTSTTMYINAPYIPITGKDYEVPLYDHLYCEDY
jgi:hypothetical protein